MPARIGESGRGMPHSLANFLRDLGRHRVSRPWSTVTLLLLADTVSAQQSKFYTRSGGNQVFPQIKGKFSSVILCTVADALTRGRCPNSVLLIFSLVVDEGRGQEWNV